MNVALILKKLNEEYERIQQRATPLDREQAQLKILQIHYARNTPYHNERRHPKKWTERWPRPW